MAELCRCYLPPPSKFCASAFRRRQARAGAFGDDRALELGQCPENVEDQPPAGSFGIDGLGQRTEAAAHLPEPGNQADKVAERPAQPVKPPDHQNVTRLQRRQGPAEARTVAAGPRDALVLKYPLTARRAQRIELQGRGLVVGRDAGVADQHCRHTRSCVCASSSALRCLTVTATSTRWSSRSRIFIRRSMVKRPS